MLPSLDAHLVSRLGLHAGVRRIPVVSTHGSLVGIVSVDDLIHLIAQEMIEIAKLISHEQRREVYARR